MARPKSTEPAPDRLSVSLPAPDMQRLLTFRRAVEEREGKPVTLAKAVREAISLASIQSERW